MWVYENPKEAAAEIDRLRERCRLQAEDIMTLGQEVGRLSQQNRNGA